MLEMKFTAANLADVTRMGHLMARIGAVLHGRNVSETETSCEQTRAAIAEAGETFTRGVEAGKVLAARLQADAAAAEPKPRRPRGTKADPVEAYVAAGGVMPADAAAAVLESTTSALVDNLAVLKSDVQDIRSDLAAAESDQPAVQPDQPTTQPDPAPAESDQPASPPPSLDELRAQVRDLANEKGALWLRPYLKTDKATKVSEMTAEGMRRCIACEPIPEGTV